MAFGGHLSVSSVKLADKCTCAWLAGLIDAEGCIVIAKVTPPSYGAQKNRYRVQIEISNTDKRLIDALVEKTGLGQVVHRRPPSVRSKESWKWIARADACRCVLNAVMPWMVCKAEQARLALRVLDIKASKRTGRWGGYGPEQIAELQGAKDQMHRLNARGVAA